MWPRECPCALRSARRWAMAATLNLIGLVFATMFAAAAAVACNWLLLRVMFHLMRPAAVRKNPWSAATKRPTVRTELARCTAELAAGFAPSRGSRRKRRLSAFPSADEHPGFASHPALAG